MITLSIVSHGQAKLVTRLLNDISALKRDDLKVILTVNAPEQLSALADVSVIRNSSPRGFGANHNAALHQSKTEYFCVLNPDIRLRSDPFPALLDEVSDPQVGVVAPRIISPDGTVEDNVRRFPSAWSLLRKVIGVGQRSEYTTSSAAVSVDWVAGMFMFFRSSAYERVGGFDERFFLYYEDVDICRRLHSAGYEVIATPSAEAVHEARRASRRNPRHMVMHARSMARYFTTNYRSNI